MEIRGGKKVDPSNDWDKYTFKDLEQGQTFSDLYFWMFLLFATPIWNRRAGGRVQLSSVNQWYQTLFNPMNCSTPGLPVHHQLPEFTQTHVHRVGDAIRPSSSSDIPFYSCPQSLTASESFPMSQLFASGGQSIGVSALASVLPKNTQDWCPLEWTGWISLQSKGLSRVFSNTTIQNHQFFSNQLSSNSHIHTWPQEKP